MAQVWLLICFYFLFGQLWQDHDRWRGGNATQQPRRRTHVHVGASVQRPTVAAAAACMVRGSCKRKQDKVSKMLAYLSSLIGRVNTCADPCHRPSPLTVRLPKAGRKARLLLLISRSCSSHFHDLVPRVPRAVLVPAQQHRHHQQPCLLFSFLFFVCVCPSTPASAGPVSPTHRHRALTLNQPVHTWLPSNDEFAASP